MGKYLISMSRTQFSGVTEEDQSNEIEQAQKVSYMLKNTSNTNDPGTGEIDNDMSFMDGLEKLGGRE